MRAVCSLWRFPSGYPGRALPGTLALWSPDFPHPGLPQAAAIQPTARATSRGLYTGRQSEVGKRNPSHTAALCQKLPSGGFEPW